MDINVKNRISQFETQLCNELTKYLLKKSLSDDEKHFALTAFRSMDKKSFINYNKNQVLHVLVRVIGDRMHKKNPDDQQIDMHNYQVQHLIADGDNISSNDKPTIINTNSIEISNLLGINDLKELKLYMNPESMYEHYYVVLDSEWRNTTNENPTSIQQFTWNYAPTQNVSHGFCNSVGTVHNIVGMRIYQPCIPYLAAMNTNGKRVSILVQEFNAQAFITEIGTRFHFLLRPQYITSTTRIELSTEDYNDGIFTFDKPFTEITSLTLVFGDPINVLTFSVPFDRFIVALEFICIKDFEPDY
jgi:hypothetical protein